MRFSRWSFFVAAALGSIGGPAAIASTKSDPALAFAAKILIGDIDGAVGLVGGPIEQSKNRAVVPGKQTISVTEFRDVVALCNVGEVKNEAPFSSPQLDVPADLRIVWLCEEFPVVAHVRSAAGGVAVSNLYKAVYAPPALPPAAEQGRN